MPHIAYTPADWAAQLQYFLQTVIQKPVTLVVQGALLPVTLEIVQMQTQSNLIQKLVLASPPAMALMTQQTGTRKQKLTWNLQGFTPWCWFLFICSMVAIFEFFLYSPTICKY